MKKAILFFSLSISMASIGFSQNFSLNFDGQDDYAAFQPCAGLTSGSFTVEGWFKTQASTNQQVIMMAYQNIPDLNANVTIEVRNTGKLRFNFRAETGSAGGSEVFSNTIINDNNWHHFAAVKQGQDKLLLYIDGFLDEFTCGSFNSVLTPPNFEVGRNRYDIANGFRWFKGNIDDLKIWNFAKTPREVFETFKFEHNGLEAGLYANYKFDIASDTIYDCSPYKRHGLRGGPTGAQFSSTIPTIDDVPCQVMIVGLEEIDLEKMEMDEFASVVPNPVADFLQIELFQQEKTVGQILTIQGKFIREFSLLGATTKVDVSDLPTGSYLLRLSSTTATASKIFLKS